MRFTETKFNGYSLYYTMHDAPEPLHGHVNKPEIEAGSAKIWVFEDGSSEIAHKGRVPAAVLRDVQEWIKLDVKNMAAKWKASFGSVTYKKGGKLVLCETEVVPPKRK